jgi:VWFA-related protein
MRATLIVILAALLIASAQQATQTPAASPQKKAAPAKQDASKQAATKKAFSFSDTVQLVVIDVFAKDKNGNPIEHLKPEDFVVSEDGKPQKITTFQYQELVNDPGPATEETQNKSLTTRGPVLGEAKKVDTSAAAVKAVTANQITPAKAGEVKYKDRRLMVLFFDMTSMPINDQIRAQDSAIKFVKQQITPSDLVAIMTFSSDVKVVEDFTDDRDALIKDIKKLTVGEGQGFGVTDQSDAASDTGAAFSADDSEFNIFNTDRQLSALETAAKMLGTLPEKKALVYFASGMTRDSNGNNQAQLTATVNAAVKANVAFYPIDARGLVASAPLGDATKGSSSAGTVRTGGAQMSAQSSFQGQQETLTTLAGDTGGKALLDENDLSVGIVQAQKDISSYYIIGYNSGNQSLDGHYRKIDLKVKDPRVAKLDYRRGYFASKNWGKFDSEDKERQLTEALMMGDPMTDIDVRAEIDYFRLGRDSYFVPVEVKIPGSDLEMAKLGNAERTRLDFIGVVKDAKGEVTGGGNVRDYVDLKLKGDKAAEITKHPVAYDTGFTLKPGKYTLKFLVRENETGKIGTFEQTFEIPNLTSDQPILPTSSVILSNQIQPITESLYSAEKDKKLLEDNPLVQNKEKLIPSVTRVFKQNQDLYVYAEVYEPLASTTQPVVAAVSFFRGKTKVFETEPLIVKEGLNPKSKALPIRFAVPLKSLKPGFKYTCQVTLLDPTAQKRSYTRADVFVTP